MPPGRRSLGSVQADVPEGAGGVVERKPKRSFFARSSLLPLALQVHAPAPLPASTPKPSAAFLTTVEPAPDFVTSITAAAPKDSELKAGPPRAGSGASGAGPRIKEVVSLKASRKSAAAAVATENRRSSTRSAAVATESPAVSEDVDMEAPRVLRTSARKTIETAATSTEPTPEPPVKKSTRPERAESPITLISPELSVATAVATQASTSTDKEYLQAGLYCQDPDAKPSPLIFAAEAKKPKNRRQSAVNAVSFPPLPIEHGAVLFAKVNDFVLPYNILNEFQHGKLGYKKMPDKYTKLRGNVFPERPKRPAPEIAVCHCDPESQCNVQCINRAMSYFCGKDCPAGDDCSNKSLTKRKGKGTKVFYTGSRGFGLVAAEPIKEGDFVIDYRGEVISLNLFYERIRSEYKNQRNFYALAYDSDEVIDAGMRGNDARFINHGCDPNLEVRKYTCMGDGVEEYEVGLWATRDIDEGEELMYDYNFDSFSTIARDSLHPDFVPGGEERRTRCSCGANNCSGFLGKKPGSATPEDIPVAKPAKRSRLSTSSSAADLAKTRTVAKVLPTSKKAKSSGKAILIKDGAIKSKNGNAPKPKSKIVGATKKANGVAPAPAEAAAEKKKRKYGLLSVAKMAISKPAHLQVDEAYKILSMTDKQWEVERKRLKKGHEWKAQQIATARELVEDLEEISPTKAMLLKDKDAQSRRNASASGLPAVLRDPSHCFRPADWAEVGEPKSKAKSKPKPSVAKPRTSMPAVLLDPSHCFRPDSWKKIPTQTVSPKPAPQGRVTVSALVTEPHRRGSRHAMRQDPSTLTEDMAPRFEARIKGPTPVARPRVEEDPTELRRASISKLTHPSGKIVADAASFIVAGKGSGRTRASHVIFTTPVGESSARRKSTANATPGPSTASPRRRAASSKVTPVGNLPLTTSAWVPPANGPKLKFKIPANGNGQSPSEPAVFATSPMSLPSSNITQLPPDLMTIVQARIDKRHKALEVERFSQGKGSAWFNAEVAAVSADEFARAHAFHRQHLTLQSAQRKLEAMTAEFTGGPIKRLPDPPIDLSAFVSPPAAVPGKKRNDFEYHTRKKPGSIYKTDAEWEEERRVRKKGAEWVRIMKEIHGVAPGGPPPGKSRRALRGSNIGHSSPDPSGRDSQSPSPTLNTTQTPIPDSPVASSSKRKASDADAQDDQGQSHRRRRSRVSSVSKSSANF